MRLVINNKNRRSYLWRNMFRRSQTYEFLGVRNVASSGPNYAKFCLDRNWSLTNKLWNFCSFSFIRNKVTGKMLKPS